jgi:pimeloyl-ACP methyl ester carboxylesterase
MYFKTFEAAGPRLFYREAGDPSKPTVLPPYGFPRRRTSSTTSFRFYLKDRRPKTLIVWGPNDPLLMPAASEFLKQLVPSALLRCFGGHFVLDEYTDAIAEGITETFSRSGTGSNETEKRASSLRESVGW